MADGLLPHYRTTGLDDQGFAWVSCKCGWFRLGFHSKRAAIRAYWNHRHEQDWFARHAGS